MKTYPLEICISIEVPAPSLEDAKSAVEDVFGPGEMEGFDMTVSSFTVKEV